MNIRRLLLCLLIAAPLGAAAETVRTDQLEAELVAEHTALSAGRTNWVALRIKPVAGWHVYWRNPGDSGIPTKLEWQLPKGITAGDIVWPYPSTERLGDLVNYGYGEEVLHLVPLEVAAGTHGEQTLAATAKWLVCKDICIPGSAALTLRLPVAADAKSAPDDGRWQAAFARARAAVPRAVAWPAQFSVADDTVSLQLRDAALAGAARIAFFPYASDLVNHAAPQRIAGDGDTLRLSQAASAYFVEAPKTVEGVVVVTRDGRTQAYEIKAQPGAVAAVAARAPAAQDDEAGAALRASPTAARDTGSAPLGLLAALGFALLGGLILNLMPCVFPVLSLKALSLARAGHAGQRAQALAYGAGVVLSCVAIAVAILVLQRLGKVAGWGFQLQSPLVVGALAYLLFALGLSLSGVASFGARLMNLGQSLTEKPGLAGAFFTGVLAVVVASPCTGPFMGAAIGYAVLQPAAITLAVFAALGLGLALPFLVIGFVPAAARLLPKPGAWMERFKQLMAFPLYLSVVWLVWVLARQLDVGAAAQLMVGLVLIAFVLWLWTAHGLVAALAKLAAAALAAALLLTLPQQGESKAAAAGIGAYASEPWSAQRVAELRGEGRTIFVDFTADWCLSCKVNERVALRSERVEQRFRDANVAVLVADWTNADPAITAELARFGRNGVPLYLVYARGGEPKILPQLLTPDLVAGALE
ncbi:protein-disulfide reductase DsbD family protein [Solimonas soli]|uniref:protein-disulfide reductase DsbD family protein n=1 Tax=Solimonas soli TaxID=413479 RepID=UPI0004B2C80D|nr:protein-disulfide reductase DsbD domain-containing protein [Solimonas soli]